MNEDIKEKVGTPEEQAVQQSWEWFDADRRAKEPIQDDLEEAYKLYNNDHWSLKDATGRPLRSENQKKNRPNTVENFAFSLIEGLVSEFCEDVDIVDYPQEPGDDDTATVMTELKKFVKYKNRLNQEREKYVRNFFLYGTAIWHYYFDPSWVGGRGPNKWFGDIRWKSLHPQAVFPDLRCRESIEDGQRIHKAIYTTVEAVKEKFDVDVEGELSLDSMVIDEQERFYDAESKEVLLVETWYKGKPIVGKDEGYGMHVIWWAGDANPTYLSHENYVYSDPDDTSIKFPFDFQTRYPRENSVWGFGEAHYLKSPQIVLNKTTELILEGHMHFSLGQTFYRPGAISPKQEQYLKKLGTLPNMYFPVNDLDGIKRVHGKGVDASLPGEANRVQRAMEGIVGRHDISQGRTPGSVVAFRALDLLAARARVRLRSAENAIIAGYENCGNYINNLIQRFYTEERAYRIIGDNAIKETLVVIDPHTGEEFPFIGEVPPGWMIEIRREQMIEYGTFRPEDHTKVYVYDNDTGYGEVMPYDDGIGEAMAETERMREEGIEFEDNLDYEIFCPELDVQCRVSTAEPTDRAFYMEMGKELMMGGLIDEETFWYILQNGKFPPYESIMQKKRKELIAQAQMQQMAMQAQMEQQQMQAEQQAMDPHMPPSGEPPPPDVPQGVDGAVVQQMLQGNPDLLAKFNQLSPEMQQNVIAEMEQGNVTF